MAREWLTETWNSTAYLSRMMYAQGNTEMENLLTDLDLGKENVNLLLLGAGDIRHLIKTVANLNGDTGCKDTKIRELNIHLNDIDEVLVARDVLLLHLIANMDPQNPEDVLFIWAIWYNMELHPGHYRRLIDTLKTLCSLSDPYARKAKKKTTVIHTFGDNKTRQECIRVWTAWSVEVYDKAVTRRHRINTLNWSVEMADLRSRSKSTIPDLSEKATRTRSISMKERTISVLSCQVELSVNSVTQSEPNHVRLPESRTRGITYQLRQWFEHGTAMPSFDNAMTTFDHTTSFINPTLMRAGQAQWHLHYKSNPFDAYLPRSRSIAKHGLTNACCRILREILTDFRRKLLSVQLAVTIWWADCIPLCLHQLPTDNLFDLIHTSNLADHLGLLPLLMVCVPRLRGPKSLLLTGTMRWDVNYLSLADYIDDHLGFPRSLLPTIFGVHLAEDLALGLTTPPNFQRGEERQIRWTKCCISEPTKITIGDDSGLCKVILTLLNKMFTKDVRAVQSERSSDLTGITLRTPALAVAIMDRLKHSLEGGAQTLMELVRRSQLMEQSRCAASCWKAVLAAYGLLKDVKTKDELLVVEVPLIGQGFPAPDHPDRVGYSPSAHAVFVHVHPDEFVRMLSSLRQGEFMSLFPNYRLDIENNFVQVMMLRSDWKQLKDYGSVGLLVGNRPMFTTPLPLVSPEVKIVKCWHVPKPYPVLAASPNIQADSFIQLERVEEYENNYKVTWNVINKGEKIVMETPKDEERCSSLHLLVTCLSWRGKEDARVTFACYVDVNTLHVQISSKRGKIFADIRKCIRWNSGRCLLPTSKLRLDHLKKVSHKGLLGDHELGRLIGMMFIGPGEMERKELQQSTSDPFYNLRETLQIIWVKLPGICKVRLKDEDDGSGEMESDVDIFTLGAYIHHGQPLLHVAYLQHQHVHQMRKRGQVSDHSCVDIYTKLVNASSNLDSTESGQMRKVMVDMQEKELLMNMLFANSLRLPQPYVKKGHPYIRHSFLQLCYPASTKAMDEVAKLKDRRKVGSTHLPSNLPSFDSMFDSSISDLSGFNFSDPVSVPAARDNGTSGDRGGGGEQKQQPCHHCKKVTRRFCSRCKRVFYCSSDCQRKEWKAHQPLCKPAQS